MLALFDYPQGFNLSLRVNFVAGADDNEGFLFTGSDGLIEIAGNSVILTRKTMSKEPGYTVDTFAKATQDAYLSEYRKKFPERKGELRTGREEKFQPPPDYNETEAHTANFVNAVRTRTPVIEDAVFGLRAAGPALLCNVSQREKRAVTWDPESMRRTDAT